MVKFLAEMTNQAWLKQKIREHGYKTPPGGICLGLACSAMQIFLTQDIKHFNNMLYYIFNYTQRLPAAFAATVTNVTLKGFLGDINRYHRHQYAQTFYTADTPSDCIFSFRYPEKINIKQCKRVMALNRKIEYISRHPASKFDNSIAEQYAVTNHITVVTKATANNIRDLLSSCGPLLNQSAVKSNIGFVLTSYRHAIMVGYNPTECTWVFVNSNQLPAQKFTSLDMLVRQIMLAFRYYKLAHSPPISFRGFAAHQDHAHDFFERWGAWLRKHHPHPYSHESSTAEKKQPAALENSPEEINYPLHQQKALKQQKALTAPEDSPTVNESPPPLSR